MPAIPWEWHWRVTEKKLTGRYRTRIQKWSHKLILQVEEEVHHAHIFDGMNTRVATRWRDAGHLDGYDLNEREIGLK